MDNSQPMRYAIYARYSSDQQRQTSIADQLRKCQEFGDAQGWLPVKNCIYTDAAISGVSTERPGLQRMLQAALSPHRSFDVILVDDTSRISRSLPDAIQLFQRLSFAGVRVIAVAQGIDSLSEQCRRVGYGTWVGGFSLRQGTGQEDPSRIRRGLSARVACRRALLRLSQCPG